MDEDGETFVDFEEIAAVNSEVRYLVLELMKLSAQRGISFEQTAKEFIQNTNSLQRELSSYGDKTRKAQVKERPNPRGKQASKV